MSKSPKKAKAGGDEGKAAKSPAPAVKEAAEDAKDGAEPLPKKKKSKSKDKAEAAEDGEAVEESKEKPKKKKKSKSAGDEGSNEESKEPKKKKKKAKPVEDDEEAAAEEEAEDEKPKKKKKKAKAPEPEADADADEEVPEIELGKKKKKKSKSKPVEDEDDDEKIGEPILDDPEDGDSKEQKDEKEDIADEDIELELDLKGKKKKKKKAADGADESAGPAKKSADGAVPWADSDRDYNYTELLERVFTLLREKNPSLAQRKKHSIAPPQMVRVGTKKSMWTNFQQNCATMHRTEEHVQSFVVAETGAESSIDGSHRLVMKGKYTPKQVESLLRKYITEYVMCSICRNPETTLTRDSVTRLYFIQCESCGSRRSVAPIKSGFHAQNKADRKKIKEAS